MISASFNLLAAGYCLGVAAKDFERGSLGWVVALGFLATVNLMLAQANRRQEA